LKKALAILICLLFFSGMVSAQYYLRGEIHNEKGTSLANVKILLFSKGNYPFFSGAYGSFGLPSSLSVDTISLFLDGYEPLKKAVKTSDYQNLVMKMQASTASISRPKLASFTKNLMQKESKFSFSANESYSNLIENDYIETNKYPETGFALNIDRASYSNIRRFINNESRVPSDAVRIDEMLNYFSFNDNSNTTKQFICNTQLTSCPWNVKNQLLFVNLLAPKVNVDKVPPSNFVFLIDVSGSMDRPTRLPLLQAGFKMLVDNLRSIDTVSIITYGGGVEQLLPATNGSDKAKIKAAIDSLYASGDTPGQDAIQTAYAAAKRSFIINGNNRVILATDGDFNVGQHTEPELEELIIGYRNSGIYLTCIGVGMGNYKDSKLEALAKKGNGNFAYIDNINEAQKIFVTEFTKTLYAVANDAFISVKFNDEFVKEYRLIGFDNKKDAVSDTTSELEGGEVGSGHSLMAVFEIIPTEKNNLDTLRTDRVDILATMRLQYKLPNNDKYQYQNFDAPKNFITYSKASNNLRFATSVIMFGSMLKQSKFCQPYSWDEVIKLTTDCIEPTKPIHAEFMQLLKKAKKIYAGDDKKKKHRKKNDN
jgi:Ca-activated chloride channel homolog